MKERKCCIFGAGDYNKMTIQQDNIADSFVIAADGGYLFLRQQGIMPDLLVGDFDSMEIEKDAPELVGKGDVICYPSQKDDTDMFLAVKEGMNRGCTTFFLYGGTGGRLDHTLANIQTLAYLAGEGLRGYLLDARYVITAIHNDTWQLKREPWQGKYISIFCNGKPACGVSLEGLKYPLQDYVMTADYGIGVSNEFAQNQATISVKEGTLIIVIERKPE